MSQLKSQIETLAISLEKYPHNQPVEWAVGKIANALIEKAKAEEPDDPVLAAVELFQPGQGQTYIDDVKAGGVRAILGQVAASLPHRISVA